MKLRPNLSTLLLAICMSLIGCERSHSARAQPHRCDQLPMFGARNPACAMECLAELVEGTIDAAKNVVAEIINDNKAPKRQVSDEESNLGRVAKSNNPNNR